MSQIPVGDMAGVIVFEPIHASDNRGAFIKIQPIGMLEAGLESIAISVNPTRGTIRGMHFQVEPFTEEKIISCIQGAILDVALDIRPSSKTYGQYAYIRLDETNRSQVYLPKGIAHGFQTLEDDSIVQYCISAPYSLESAVVINPINCLGISWPLNDFLISDRDLAGVDFKVASRLYIDSLGLTEP